LVLARWADGDGDLHPTSVPDEANEIASIATDTLRAEAGADAWQLRVTLLRPVTAPERNGDAAGPLLTYLGAMVSAVPERLSGPSHPGPAAGRILDVPALSQRVHSGHYPQWDG